MQLARLNRINFTAAFLLIVVVLTGLVVFAATKAGNSNTSAQGVQGTVTVLKCGSGDDEKDECPHYSFTIIAKKSNDPSVAAQATANKNGTYKLGLNPGTYILTYKTSPGSLQPEPKTVVVKAKQYQDISWSISPPEGKPKPPARPAGIPDPSTLKYN